MKAIAHHDYGSPRDVLRLTDVDEPAVGDDEVLVHVHAASLNPADWHLIRGKPYIARLQAGLRRPRFGIPGCDLAGQVEAVGQNVRAVRAGDEVFGSAFLRGFGAFAERVSVPEDVVVPKPGNLSFEQAAAVPLAALTALQGLRDHGRVEPGHRVLVVGASGGVGTFAVQVASSLGAEVTGVCSTRNVDLVRSLGAHHVIDYTTDDFTEGDARYDVVLQVSGTHSPLACRRALGRDGTLVQISGDSPGRWIGAFGRMVTARLLSPFVSQRLTACSVKPNREDLQALAQLIEAGSVTPVIERTYSLGEVPEALMHLEQGHVRGKLAVSV